MTAGQWINANIGKALDFDGVYGYQCKDVINFYNRDVVGGPRFAGNAIDAWTNYPTSAYTRISNTPSFVPKCGDIMIWGMKPYGHIAVCTGNGNVNWFESLDQNWSPTNGTTPCKIVRHNYTNVLGVLRPKKDVNFDQAAYEAQLRAEAERKAAEAAAAKAKADAIAKMEAEKAKAEADRIAAEKAAAEKAEQQRILAEQARLEEELKAKEEAERIKWYEFIKQLVEWLKGVSWKK